MIPAARPLKGVPHIRSFVVNGDAAFAVASDKFSMIDDRMHMFSGVIGPEDRRSLALFR